MFMPESAAFCYTRCEKCGLAPESSDSLGRALSSFGAWAQANKPEEYAVLFRADGSFKYSYESGKKVLPLLTEWQASPQQVRARFIGCWDLKIGPYLPAVELGADAQLIVPPTGLQFHAEPGGAWKAQGFELSVPANATSGPLRMGFWQPVCLEPS